VYGELPVACLAEEIETPGEGQIRALVTIAGNPALSTPNAGRLQKSLASLEFMVSVDIYRNETTRHANVILPAPSSLARGHYDLALYNLAVRNVANYSAPLYPLAEGELDEWEVLLKLGGVASGLGPTADVERLARWLYSFEAVMAHQRLPFSSWPERWENSGYWKTNPDKRQALVDHWIGLAHEAVEYARLAPDSAQEKA